MSTIFIIANILSLLGNIMFTSSIFLISKKKIIFFQTVNHILSGISMFLIGAFAALVQEMSALIRNVILLFIKTESELIKIIISSVIVLIATVLSIVFNISSNSVWFSYLPMIGAVIYSAGVILAFVIKTDELNSGIIIKSGLIFNSTIWTMYGIFIKVYPISIFNALNVTISIISIIRTLNLKKKKQKQEQEQAQEQLEN